MLPRLLLLPIRRATTATITTRTAISRICLQFRSTSSSTSTADKAPPILAKIRKDMTAALKAKDTNRLNVLRALLAETTNAAKTSQPITTDLAFLNLLRKRITASQAAADEFAAASREDLKHKEEAQLQVLEEYAKNMDVEVVSREEMELAVDRAVGSMKQEQEETVRAGGERVTVTMGRVVKRLLDEGGELSGKSVDKAMLVHVVDVMLGTGERKKKKKEEKEEEEGKGKSIGDFVKRLSRTLSERELEEISERMEFPPPARYLGDPPR